MLWDFLILLGSLALLVKSSQLVVDSVSKLTQATRLKEMTMGFILLALATNIPELAVTFSSVLSGNVEIPIGNILGSHVADVCLVIGMMALIAPTTIRIRIRELETLSSILFITSFIPLLLWNVGTAGWVIGIILLGVYIYFYVYVTQREIKSGEEVHVEKINLLSTLQFLCINLFVVIVTANFVVSSAISLATSLGISPAVIGALTLGLGTSLPELWIGMVSVKKGHTNLGLSNTIGSCLTNLTLLLGLVFLFSPIKIDFATFSSLLFFTVSSSLILWYLIRDRKIQVTDGLWLLLFYLVFILTISGIEIIKILTI